MPKVSIIMPSLNVGKYVKKCIHSVSEQTLKDIEILVIDAGSTDGTLEIINEYVLKDSRIRLIHSDKKSYGYQVNLGIREAKGEYIGIVETDDYIESNMYEVLYSIAKKNDVDYVKGQGCFEIWIFGDDYKQTPIIDFDAVTPDTVIIPNERYELQTLDYYIWLGLYKKSFISQIKLNETPGAAYQDVGFALKCHSKAKAAIYTDKLMYHYMFGSEGTSSVSHKGLKYILQEYKLNKDYLENLDSSFADAYYKKMFYQIRTRHYQMAFGISFWQDALEDNDELQHIIRRKVDDGSINISRYSDEEWAQLMLYRESPYALYGAVACDIKTNVHRISELSRNINKYNGCVLVGTGQKSKYPYALIKRNNLGALLGVCDNSVEKHGCLFYDEIIISVEEAVKKYPYAYYIITSKKYGNEMELQLLTLGINIDNICIYNLGEDINYLM